MMMKILKELKNTMTKQLILLFKKKVYWILWLEGFFYLYKKIKIDGIKNSFFLSHYFSLCSVQKERGRLVGGEKKKNLKGKKEILGVRL